MRERKYKESHPWLTFILEADRFPYHFWERLGECVSKCDQLKDTPMSIKLHSELTRIYLCKGVAATTAIEGNALSEEQVGKIIAGNMAKPSKTWQPSHIEINNVKDLYNEILSEAQRAPLPPLSPQRLCYFQKKILTGLDVEGNVGKIRERGVGVEGSNYQGAPYEDCAHLLEELCRWLREGEIFRQVVAEVGVTAAAILRAALAHLYIAWIHPFDDGNGRTARAAELYLLIAGGIPAYAAHLPSNYCNKLRDKYYNHLSNATEKHGLIAFIGFIMDGLRDGLKEQLQKVYKEQRKLIWLHIIREKISDSTSLEKTRERRINLVFFLPIDHPFGLAALLRIPEITALYAKTSGAALLQNDLEHLIKQGIVIKTEGGYQINSASFSELTRE